MKKLLLFLLSTSILAHGQAFRWSTTAQTVNSSAPQPGALLPALNIPNASIAVCTYPANGVPCTNYATTYTDPSGTTTCPGAAQLTGNNSAICIAKSDVQGNVGAWLKTGNYQYTVTTRYGSFGPYDITMGSAGVTSGNVTASPQFSLFYQPNSGTQAAAVGDSHVTTDGSGNLNVASVSSAATGLTPSTATVCPNGTGGALTTSGCAAGSGTVSGQANGIVPLATSANGITAQSHLDDGVTIANTITASRPFNASVNKVLNVTAPPYNAKCDGTTDDQTAIQAAFNDAATLGAAVQFPAGTCKTHHLVWNGQAFFGASMSLTFLLGFPCDDVLQGPDTAGTYIQNTIHKDLTIQVDSTCDASATAAGGNNTFPTRVAGTAGGLTPLATPMVSGPMRYGGPAGCLSDWTAASTTFFLNCGGFTSALPSLVIGQQITSDTANTAGTLFTTTIVSITDSTHVVVAAAPPLSVHNGTGTWGAATGISPPYYMGNCGIALPNADGSVHHTFPNGWTFENIAISAFGQTHTGDNHTCGIFAQVPLQPAEVNNLVISNLWGGYIEALPYTNQSAYEWTPDDVHYTKLTSRFNLIPLVMNKGNHRAFGSLSMYSANLSFSLGPIFLSEGTTGVSTFSGDINQMYWECSGQNSGEVSRVASGPLNVHAGSWGQCGGPTIINWLASNSTVDAQVGPSLVVNGSFNSFTHYTQNNNATVTNNGFGNSIINTAAPGALTRRQSAAGGIAPRTPVGFANGDFLQSGNSQTPFRNYDDLLAGCSSWIWSSTNTGATCVQDPTGFEQTNTYSHNLGSGGNITIGNNTTNYSNWTLFSVGSTLPQAKMNVITFGRCNGAGGTCSATITFHSTSPSNVNQNLNTCVVTYGSAWTTQGAIGTSSACVLDLTAVPQGYNISFGSNNFIGTPASVDLAYMGFQPVPTDTISAVLANPAFLGSIGPYSGGPIVLTAADSTWRWQSQPSVVDATSPVGYSNVITSATALNGWKGLTGPFNVGYDAGALFPPVQQVMSVLVQAPAVITDTLGANQLIGDTTITVTTPQAAWGATGCLQVDHEIECYSGSAAVSATTYTVTRAQFGTLAAAHSSGAAYTSVGTGQITTSCTGVPDAANSIVVFTPTWNWYASPFAAQYCSGLAVTVGKLTFPNGPTGQTYKVAAIAVTLQPSLPNPAVANVVPVSALSGTANATYSATKALAGSGAGITTGPTTTVSGDVMTATGTAGQIADGGTLASLLVTPLTTPPAIGGTTPAAGSFTALKGTTLSTTTNCTSSAAPAVCAAAASGSVVVAAAGTTVVVNTTAVTANSQIIVQEDSSLGTKLTVTCNTTPATAPPTVSARTAATSFTITTTTPTTNPRCFSYMIFN